MDQDLRIRLGNIEAELGPICHRIRVTSRKREDVTLDEIHAISTQLHDLAFKTSEIGEELVERM